MNKQNNRSNVLIHSKTRMVNSKGVLWEHPLKKHPNQTILKKISATFPKYFIFFMRNILSAGAEERQLFL